MANRSEAYDYSYFEDISSNGAVIDDYAYSPLEQPGIEEQPEKKVVPLPRRQEHLDEVQVRRKKLRSNARAIAKYMAAIAIVAGVSMTALHTEVQLAEVNEMISDTKSQLEEAESLEVQLTMQAAQKMTDAQVEQYAVEELGMGKLSSSQVVYLHVTQQDKGTVVQETGGESWFQKMLSAIRGWFA